MVARVMSVLSDIAHKQEICREILTTLPGYGQDHAALDARITAIAPLDVFIEFDGDAALGFIALKAHSPIHIEIYLLAVRRAAQRQGIGSRLLAAAEAFGQDHGADYLSVQAVPAQQTVRVFAKTDAFLRARGFADFMSIPNDTDGDRPGLQMLKHIKQRHFLSKLQKRCQMWCRRLWCL